MEARRSKGRLFVCRQFINYSQLTVDNVEGMIYTVFIVRYTEEQENMSAIEWMMNKATTETLEDGTVSYYFNGMLPSRMVAEIKKLATNSHSTPKSTSYTASGETFGWSAVFGAYISTQHAVRFTFNDYTVPAGKAG